MTRDRAIEILIGLQDGSGSTYEAVRLAIEALEESPRPIDPTITVDLESGVVPISACEPKGPKTIAYVDRPRGEWISKEELIGAINDAEFVYDGDEDGHKEHDISELVRVTVKDIIGSLSSADMRGDTE